MAEHSHIEWTDATWNPITGCSVVSPGCTNCYAMKLAGGRLKNLPSRAGLTAPSKAGPVWTGDVRLNKGWLTHPLDWARPRRIFVCAHGDLFHEAVPDHWIDQVFAVMALAPRHTFQVLTKRPARMRAYLAARGRGLALYAELTLLKDRRRLAGADLVAQGFADPADMLGDYRPLPNVWLGVSAEDQPRFDERWPDLRETPAAVRFLSAEPLLGRIEILPGLDWVIAGGESGAGARPMHPDWVRTLRDDCAAGGVAFFFKQWGVWAPVYGRDVEPSIALAVNGAVDRTPPFGLPLTAGPRPRWAPMIHTSKALAGRVLDGVTHDAMPALASARAA